MQKDSNSTNLLLEIVDKNNTLIACLSSTIVFRDHLSYRAVGSFIEDEEGCLLLRLTNAGLLHLPVLTPLPAGNSRLKTVCDAILEFIPEAHPYNERILAELWTAEGGPCFLTLCHVRVAHSTLLRKTKEDPNVVLLTKIEQKEILRDEKGLSPVLTAAMNSYGSSNAKNENSRRSVSMKDTTI